MKKTKNMYWKVRIELSINGNTRNPQIYTLPQLPQKIVEFTD